MSGRDGTVGYADSGPATGLHWGQAGTKYCLTCRQMSSLIGKIQRIPASTVQGWQPERENLQPIFSPSVTNGPDTKDSLNACIHYGSCKALATTNNGAWLKEKLVRCSC